jgi:hypothetical protein
MLKAKNLPGYFWGEAVTTTVHILNRAPTRALDGKTPFEAQHGEKPPVHYFKTFECIGHVKNTRPGLWKLEDRSCPMIFIGYEHGSKAYHFYNPTTERVVVSRDTVFDEGGASKWPEQHGVDAIPHDSNTFTIEFTEEYQPTSPATEHRSTMPHTSSPASVPMSSEPAAPGTSDKFVSPPSEHELDLDNDHDDDAPLRFRAIDSVILVGSTTPGPVPRILDNQLHFTSAEEPGTFNAAEREPCWKAAMTEEMKSIIDNAT